MIIYIAGKYSGDTAQNIKAARVVAIELWEAGFAVFTPHLNTAGFELDCKASYTDYLAGGLEILAGCDALVLLPGWQESKGAAIECVFALVGGMPVYAWPDRPVLDRGIIVAEG